MIATSIGTVSKREWRYCAPCQASWRGKHSCPKCAGKGVKRTAYEYTLIVDGKRERKQFPTRAEAQTALDARKEEVQHPKPVEAPPVPTLAEVFAKFLAQKSRKKTAPEFERVSRHLLAAFGAETLITDITSERISDYKATRLAIRRNGKPLTGPDLERFLPWNATPADLRTWARPPPPG